MERQYNWAGDCPYCGEKDALWAYKGARVGSTRWGHNYSCCSEECGVAFLNSPQHKALEIKSIRNQIDCLQGALKRWEDTDG